MKKTALALVLTVFVCFMAYGCGTKEATSEVSSPTEEASTAGSEAADPVAEPSIQNDSQGSSDKVMAERLSKEATTNTISEELKKKALEMPYADYQNLPSWHGTTLMNKTEYGWGPEGVVTGYSEELVGELAEVGFNFIRVTQDTRIYFLEKTGEPGEYFNGNSDIVNIPELEMVDDLIGWCIDKGIHVCLDVHSTPGGYMIGGDEEASRELLFTEGSEEEQIFIDYWEFMAMRYADIPNNALSFNLYNEPPYFATDEQYSALMKKALNVIRKTTPDRLIFVDMLKYGREPVYGLVGEKVVQTFHSYEPYEFTHNLVNNADYEAGRAERESAVRQVVTYPLPAVALGIRDGYIVTGDFPAGTELTIRFGEGQSDAETVLLADGKQIFTQKFDKELLTEHGFVLDEYDNFAYYVDANPGVSMLEYKITIEEPAKELKFNLKNDHWLDVNELIIATDTYKAKLVGQWIESVGDELPPTRAHVDDKGIVTLTNDAAKYNIGKETLREMFQKYVDFREETGTQVMLQEFGDCVYTEINGAQIYYDDMLSLCEEDGFNWCHYAFDGGDFSLVAINESYKRRGATYEKLSSGREICTELKDVLQKHMN